MQGVLGRTQKSDPAPLSGCNGSAASLMGCIRTTVGNPNVGPTLGSDQESLRGQPGLANVKPLAPEETVVAQTFRAVTEQA